MRCAACGTEIIAVVSTGPDEHRAAPCGHRVIDPVAEYVESAEE